MALECFVRGVNGEHITVVRNPKDELKTGTLHAMCKQLGIGKDEL
jgi:mRNA interferase HicA